MIKEDIIRGLEGAMSKGETLDRAMYSFYNAGYNKEDVEAAAHALSIHLSQHDSRVPFDVSKLNIPKPMPAPAKSIEISEKEIPHYEPGVEIKSPSQRKPEQLQINLEEYVPMPTLKPMIQPEQPQVPNFFEAQKPRVVQQVSAYGNEQLGMRRILIIILSVILFVLLGSLASIFIFREALLNFFGNLF